MMGECRRNEGRFGSQLIGIRRRHFLRHLVRKACCAPGRAAAPRRNSPFLPTDAALALDPALGKKVGGVLLFVLTSSKKEFTVDCKAGKVTEGKGAKADCTLTISDENFMAMSEGKLNGMQVRCA